MGKTQIHQLIRRCLRKDTAAQKMLYDQYKHDWFLCCLRYSKDKKDAEDILQDGLISIFRDLKSFDSDKASFATWSNKVMVNAALQYLRKWKKLKYSTVSIEHAAMISSPQDIFSTIGTKELTTLIQNLPAGYRVVFNMYVIEGYKHREIAEKLGISVGTSKSQLFKAKEMLRNQLEHLLQKVN